MRYLLDEMLSDLTAKTIGVLGAPDEYVYLLDLAAASTDDPDIPAICKDKGFDVLVTVNVKDFGARKAIYEAVIKAGVHVLVLRPKKGQPANNYWTTSVLARHLREYRKLFTRATEPTLGSLSDGGVRPITLDEIMTEIQAQAEGKKHLP